MTEREKRARTTWLHCQHLHPELRDFNSLPEAIESIALQQGYALSVLAIDGKAREPYPQKMRAIYENTRKSGPEFWEAIGEYSLSARMEIEFSSRQALIFLSYTSANYIVWLLSEGQRCAAGKVSSLRNVVTAIAEWHLSVSRVMNNWLQVHTWLQLQIDPLPREQREEVTRRWCWALRKAERIVPEMSPFLLTLIERDIATDLFITTSLMDFGFHRTADFMRAPRIFVGSDTKGHFTVNVIFGRIERDLGAGPLEVAIDLFERALHNLS